MEFPRTLIPLSSNGLDASTIAPFAPVVSFLSLLESRCERGILSTRPANPKQIYNETMKKFDNGTYQKPARAGISYMTGPLMRSYPAPDAIEVMTMALPHYMFYAPNVKNADVGGKPGSAYPFILPQGPGPHDVIILLVGETEKAKILADSSDLLNDLCSYRKYLCLNTGSPEHH